MTERYENAPMDLDYLERLKEGCSLPDGDLVTNRFVYEDGPDKGSTALYQVTLRGDDALELIRLAKTAADRIPVTLERHSQIVRSIYHQQAHTERLLSVILGRAGQHGHRFYGERCVWCGVNYLDDLIAPIASDENPCGPAPGEWSDAFWPFEKVDALLNELRST